MLLISWHWSKWWRRLHKPLKILQRFSDIFRGYRNVTLGEYWLSWYRFYLSKGYLRDHFFADCYLENSIKAAEKAKRDSATKMIIKSRKSKVPRDFSNFLSNGDSHDWAALSNNKKNIALTECSVNTIDDLLTWARVCVTKVNRVLSIFSNAWQSQRGKYEIYCLPSRWKHCRQNFYFR